MFTQLSVYDDKLILWNPGALSEELSIEELKKKHASYPRNKNIADIFFKAGYIETWGRGTNKIVEVCKAAGLPESDFVEHAGGIQTIFLKDIYTKEYLEKMGLTVRQVQAILFTKKAGKITNKIFQQFFSVSRNTATNELNKLVELKLLISSKQKGAGSYFTLR